MNAKVSEVWLDLPGEMQIKINQFVVDVCRLTCQLDEVGRRDHPDIRRAAAEKGQAVYQELLERERELALTPEDSRMIQTMLSGIRARLKFLF